MGKEIIFLVASVFLLVGLATTALLLLKIRKALACKNWPSVSGDLLSAELRLVVYQGVDGQSISDQASALVVDFRYRYEVGGEVYTGERVTFSDGVNKRPGAVRKLQQRYAGKERVTVFYNPQKPKEAVLVPGVSLYNFTPLITSCLFMVVAAFMFNYGVLADL